MSLRNHITNYMVHLPMVPEPVRKKKFMSSIISRGVYHETVVCVLPTTGSSKGWVGEVSGIAG